MSYDDPNREAVGMSPIWTGADGEVVEPKAGSSGSATFDPGEHTVAEVQDYIADNPDQEAAVLKAEAKGKNRATLTG